MKKMSNQTQTSNEDDLAMRFVHVARAGLLPSAPIDLKLAKKTLQRYREEVEASLQELRKKYPRRIEQE